MAKSKIAKTISDSLQKELEKIQKGAKDKPVLEAIGAGVITEMRDMIAKGISPIEGNGRFPEYKGQARAKSLNKQASSLSREAEGIASNSPFSRRMKKQLANKAKDLRKVGKQTKKKTYPYSVQSKFPSKRPRPVNLFLSGGFLSRLKKFVTGSDEFAKLEVGFAENEKDSKGNLLKDIEEGHRVGWLGQGKRPIIPTGNERLAQRIQRVVEKILGQQLAKKLRAK